MSKSTMAVLLTALAPFLFGLDGCILGGCAMHIPKPDGPFVSLQTPPLTLGPPEAPWFVLGGVTLSATAIYGDFTVLPGWPAPVRPDNAKTPGELDSENPT